MLRYLLEEQKLDGKDSSFYENNEKINIEMNYFST